QVLSGSTGGGVAGGRATASGGGARRAPLVGEPMHLVATRDGGYRFLGQSGTFIRFSEDRDGAPVMVAGFIYAEAAAWWPARLRILGLGAALWLLELPPPWGALVLVLAIARRGRVVALDLALWPTIAGVYMLAFPRLVHEAGMRNVLGDVHPLTIAIFALTIAFATAALAGVASAIRWSVRPDRPALVWRLVPTAAAVAAPGVAPWRRGPR